MRTRAYAYAHEAAPTFFTASAMDAGQALQRDMLPWFDKLRAAGCDPGPTPSGPPAPAPFFSFLGELPPVLLVGALWLLARELKH
jgi:hypothetical protein